MIQRIQSIFLFLCSFCFWSEFIFPFASSNMAASGFLADQLFNVNDHFVFVLLTVAGGLLSLIAIFLFKNRKLQIKIVQLAIVVAILFPILVILLFLGQTQSISSDVQISDRPGAYIPAGAILFGFLALRYIKKDEKLVRSMDRLR